jgi:uncharacterized membrane protein
MVIGSLIVMAFGAVVGWGLNAVDESGGIGGIVFVLSAAIAGLVGSEISRHMPPRRPHH